MLILGPLAALSAELGAWAGRVAGAHAENIRVQLLIARADTEIAKALVEAARNGRATDQKEAVRQAREITERCRANVLRAFTGTDVGMPAELTQAFDSVKNSAAQFLGEIAKKVGQGAALFVLAQTALGLAALYVVVRALSGKAKAA